MLLTIWRFITLMFTALTMGLLFGHFMEMSPKLSYDGSLYVTIQNSLYKFFGPPVGAALEVGALITSLVLVFLVRKRGAIFYWTLAGAVCLIIAIVVYFTFTEPVNVVIEQSSPSSIPSDWMRLRRQWEYSHAFRFVLYLIGFSTFLISILIENIRMIGAGYEFTHTSRLAR